MVTTYETLVAGRQGGADSARPLRLTVTSFRVGPFRCRRALHSERFDGAPARRPGRAGGQLRMTKRKGNRRHTEFAALTLEEVASIARNPNLPPMSAVRLRQRRKLAGSGSARSATDRRVLAQAPRTLKPMRRGPRYRLRMWLREHAPEPLSRLFPPGSRDCGEHEWFPADDATDRCWHCLVGVRPHRPVPIDPDSGVWQGLREAARSGDSGSQRIVLRMMAGTRLTKRSSPLTCGRPRAGSISTPPHSTGRPRTLPRHRSGSPKPPSESRAPERSSAGRPD